MKLFKQTTLLITLTLLSIGALAQKSVALVSDNGKLFHLIDENNNIVNKLDDDSKYELLRNEATPFELSPFYNGMTKVRKNKKELGFFTTDGRFLSYPKLKEIKQYSEGQVEALTKEGWGFLNTECEKTIDFQYKKTKPFKNGRAWVLQKNDNWIQINPKGENLFNNEFDDFRYFKNEYARVKVKGNDFWGFIDTKGDFIAGGCVYEKNDNFYNGYACVKKDDKWGVINLKGEFVLKPEYDKVHGFLKKGYAIFNKGDEAIIVDKNINIIASGYKKITLLNDNYMKALKGDLWAVLNPQGKEIAPAQFQKVKNPREGVMIIRKNEKVGFLTTNGEIKLLGNYDVIKPMINGTALVKKGNKWGYVNNQLKEIIPPKFIRAFDFHFGLAIVKEEEGLYGYINKSGEYVIEPKFETAKPFFEDPKNSNFFQKNSASSHSKIYTKNADNCDINYTEDYNKVFNIIGSRLKNLTDSDLNEMEIARVKIDGLWAVINKNGDVIIDKLQNIETPVNDFLRFRKNGKWGFLNYQGKVIIEAEYIKTNNYIDNCF